MPSPLTLPRAPLMELAPWKKRQVVLGGRPATKSWSESVVVEGWPLQARRAPAEVAELGQPPTVEVPLPQGHWMVAPSQKEATEPPVVPRKVAPRMSSLAKK
jgi:hypothetical protein